MSLKETGKFADQLSWLPSLSSFSSSCGNSVSNTFHGALPQITSLLGCSPLKGARWVIRAALSLCSPLGRRAVKKKSSYMGLLCSNDFSLGRKVSRPGKTACSAQACSFLRKLVPWLVCPVQVIATLLTQHPLTKNCTFGIPVFLKQMHVHTQQACLCNYHP